ncbi:hypothetical protein BT93_G1482 [Corymbia citriodora subsp. variegata]|nr:hypothetical protein BT93_G1482 [Corymbia citriodora subsp. variegata]
MASYFYISFVPLLLCGLSHSKVLTNVSCIDAEREALVKFKQDLTDPSKRLWSWTSEDCCKWQGVTCNEKTGHVSKLDLRNPCDGLEKCSLGGKIHIAPNKLKHLKYLDLSFNNFSTQKIPESLASLKKLEYLNLSNGGFYGDIPHQLSNLSKLQYLDLGSGLLEHSLEIENPRWLSTFSNLKYLDLSSTYGLDTKEWLSPINTLSSLEFLILSGCGLEDVPASLHVNFTSLRFLDLSYNSLNSSIPPWFQNFSKLEHLDLSNNDLQGIFPAVILENSAWLKFFDVSGNKLEGELLTNLSVFCNLQVLSLCYNKFSGRISDIKGDALICGQSKLKIIDVSNNNFSGHLPNQFGNFKDLEFLDLSWNSISGPIPTSVGQLLSLRMLQLSSNKLSGNIPESIGQLSNLEVMDIGDNQLDGVVNELHFASLTSLTLLYFRWNELIINVSTSWVPSFQIQAIFMSSCKVGPKFPNWLRTQREIWALDLSNASISDEVPNWLSDILFDIEVLNLSGNMLRGKISQIIGKRMPLLTQMSLSRSNLTGGIPNSLCMLDSLSFLDLSKNQLSGIIPQCWRKSQTYLRWILLGDNKLKGQIPNSICYLKELGVLSLHGNGLNGVIPKCLLKLHLEILDLSDNQFTGRVPLFGQHSRSFRIIDLEKNYFTRDIPLQLCHLANLQYLSLAHNNLSGGIPCCFNNFSQMWANSTFDPYGGFMSGISIMAIIKGRSLEFTKTLLYLFSIDLSSNALDRQIPKGLTRLARLQNLNLSQNKLIGKIPPDIGNLRYLESLDLSNNMLSGEIPPSISNLDFLSRLDLSFNNLSGHVPSGNHLRTLDDQSIYQGNDGLCGAPLLKVCPGDEHNMDGHNSSEDKSNEGDSVINWFYSGLGLGFAVALMGFCGILHVNQSWRTSYFEMVDRIVEKLSTRMMIAMV